MSNIVVHLVRKPLSESSVAKNVLKHGAGSLNIDASRVRSEVYDSERRVSQPGGGSVDGVYGDMQGYTQEGERHNLAGRWPANLILQHKAECERVGTKRVKTYRGGSTERTTSESAVSAYNSGWVQEDGKSIGYADAEGKETVDAWDCAPGCSVPDLDAQSGLSIHTLGATHADQGGASRFYRQVKPTTNELTDYFRTMISPLDPLDPAIDLGDLDHVDWGHVKAWPSDSITGIITSGTLTNKQSNTLLRVLKPGGHICLTAPDTQPTGYTGVIHLEDAGFEVRDAILLVQEAEGLHYVPKASRSERKKALIDDDSSFETTQAKVQNVHPTVKPIKIMRWLVANMIPPVVDPFMGSGTTLVACVETQLDAIGIEQEHRKRNPERPFFEIAEARVHHADKTSLARSTILSTLTGTHEPWGWGVEDGPIIDLRLGDCVEIMAAMQPRSIGSICCDPPYGLKFMGSQWDDLGDMVAWHMRWLEQAFRVLKPGGIIKMFSGTRTYHHLAYALMTTGFTNLDMVAWVYGSGFNKSKNHMKPAWEPILIARTPP